MKKWVVFFIVLLLLGFGYMKFKTELIDSPNELKLRTERPDKSGVDMQVDGLTLSISKEMIYKGDLLLINKDHPVPESLNPGVDAVSLLHNPELIDGFGVIDSSVRLSARLVDKFRMMIKDAAQEGIVRFLLASGYRNHDLQEELYQELGAQLAMPAGFSEHNLGLALDINSSQGNMYQAPEGKWLKDKSWKYGFILRYPEDKTAVTGVQFEPWHFRYVGLPHSAIMWKKNLVLEEYLEYLKQQEWVSAAIGKDRYQVFYYPVTESHSIIVPAQGEYEVSGNNLDGVIVTIRN